MHQMVLNVITAALYKRRKFRMFKRSDPRKRMRNRMYYKKNRARIKAKRKLYRIKNRVHNRLRRQKKQVNPLWFARQNRSRAHKSLRPGQISRAPVLRSTSSPRLRDTLKPRAVTHAFHRR